MYGCMCGKTDKKESYGRKLCCKTETEKSINQTTMKAVFLLTIDTYHQEENKEDKIASRSQIQTDK